VLTLSLFRHTKSNWPDTDLGDFDRELAPRGEQAAPAMGAYMRSVDLSPELVLCSPALRAVQTARLTLCELPETPKIEFDERLYHAGSDNLLAILYEVSDAYASIMIIGHNPGLHVFALDLVGASRGDLVGAMSTKFPTGALAVFSFDVQNWTEIEARQATLNVFMTPKRLPSSMKHG